MSLQQQFNAFENERIARAIRWTLAAAFLLGIVLGWLLNEATAG